MSSRNIIQIPSESVLREQLARATAEVKKLELLIDVAKKLDEIYDGVSHHGLGGYAVDQKPCVAQEKKDREKWTEAEEDLLHKCCQNTSVVKGVRIFREKTGYKRTQGACELRANEMKRKGRW